MGMAVKLFTYDPEMMAALPIEFRHQRALKKNRVPEIADYIVGNRDDYLFSSITVSVDTNGLVFHESEIDPNVGLLELPMEVEWLVNDGQHRMAGIAEALRHDATLKSDNLSVVILPRLDLERSQQVFSDLNRTVQKTSKSLDILFDHRLPINRITMTVMNEVPLFKGRTDKEHVSLALRSSDFTTLSALQAANRQLLPAVDALPAEVTDADWEPIEQLAVEYWTYLTDLIEPWADIAAGELKPATARVEYLSSYALALFALGAVGSAVDIKRGGDWRERLKPLQAVNWLKTNPEWEGICISNGEVITRTPTRKATAGFLKWKLGIGPKPGEVL
jgi:DNA sulfur modification protein DndB